MRPAARTADNGVARFYHRRDFLLSHSLSLYPVPRGVRVWTHTTRDALLLLAR